MTGGAGAAAARYAYPALRGAAGPETLPALTAACTDDRLEVLTAAITALGHVGDHRAAPAILPLATTGQ